MPFLSSDKLLINLLTKSVCDEYNFQARIQIQIYSGLDFLANTNTNIFGLTFFGEYEYEYIRILFFRRVQIRIYSGLPKMDEYEYEYNYLD